MCSINNGNSVIDSTLFGAAVGNNNNITNNINVTLPNSQFTRQEQHDINVYNRIVSEIPNDVPGYFRLMCNTLMYEYEASRFIPHTVYKLDDVNNHFINSELQSLAKNLHDSFNELYGFMALNFFEDDNKIFWMGEGAKSDRHVYCDEFNRIIDEAENAYKKFRFKVSELFGI